MANTRKTVCGDKVKIRQGGAIVELTCNRPHGHPVLGINEAGRRPLDLHSGNGWSWDDRCAWPKKPGAK